MDPGALIRKPQREVKEEAACEESDDDRRVLAFGWESEPALEKSVS